MSAYGRLAKNTMIFGIANFSSKLIVIIMIPYYTYVLTTTQLGTADALVSLVSLIVPIITLYIQDSVLRFSMDKAYDHRQIISNSFLVIIIGFILCVFLFPILLFLNFAPLIIITIYFMVIMQSLNAVLGQFARGINKINEFALSGVLATIVLVVFNVFFLTIIKMGIVGYLLSIGISYFASSTYLFVRCRIWNFLSMSNISRPILSEMLIYCLPLIPNAIMWWIVNLSDRYLIILFLGASANGVYAIANKIPTILNLLNAVFGQAWMLSAIEEKDSKKSTEFASNIFNLYAFASILLVLGLISVIRPLIYFGIGSSFFSAWKYIPALTYAITFSGFAAFLGCIYAAVKDTKSAMFTTILSAICNIVLNIVLIPFWGINGAGISTFISMLVLFLYRAFNSKKYILIKYDFRLALTAIIIILIQLISYYFLDLVFSFILGSSLVVLFLLLNSRYIMKLVNKIKKRS